MIKVDAIKHDGMLACSVEDQGTNYSDSLVAMLTKHFSENDTSLNLTMGIGLAVAQIIMEAHEGNLFFEKTTDNRGCLKMVFPFKE